jgi:hypothetical protein
VSFVVKDVGGFPANCQLLFASCYFFKDHSPKAQFNLGPNLTFYHLFAKGVNEKEMDLFPPSQKDRKAQGTRLVRDNRKTKSNQACSKAMGGAAGCKRYASHQHFLLRVNYSA